MNATYFLYLGFMVFNIRIFFRSISAGLRVGHIFVSTLTAAEIPPENRQASHSGCGLQEVFPGDT